MSRIARYRESINKFIVDKGVCSNDNMNLEVLETDLILPIILLTVMNNQCKKLQVKKQLQGYYASVAICFYTLAVFTKESDKKKLYETLAFSLIVNNIESISYYLEASETVRITLNILNRQTKIMQDNIKLNQIIVKSDGHASDEVNKWYTKDSTNLKQLVTPVKIHHESYSELMKFGLTSLCELAFVVGWLLGSGGDKETPLIEMTAKEFSQMYKMSLDFKTLDSDIKQGKTLNYVINYGIQSAYNIFMKSKEKFIEHCVSLDMYTFTIKEIVAELEGHIDKVMENMSVDTKSLFPESQSENE